MQPPSANRAQKTQRPSVIFDCRVVNKHPVYVGDHRPGWVCQQHLCKANHYAAGESSLGIRRRAPRDLHGCLGTLQCPRNRFARERSMHCQLKKGGSVRAPLPKPPKLVRLHRPRHAHAHSAVSICSPPSKKPSDCCISRDCPAVCTLLQALARLYPRKQVSYNSSTETR